MRVGDMFRALESQVSREFWERIALFDPGGRFIAFLNDLESLVFLGWISCPMFRATLDEGVEAPSAVFLSSRGCPVLITSADLHRLGVVGRCDPREGAK